MDDLRVLEIAGVGSRALPKGFQHTGPDHTRPFQLLYDQRYASAAPAAPPKSDARERDRSGRSPQPPPTSSRYGQSSPALAPPGSGGLVGGRDQGTGNKLRPPSAASYHSSSSTTGGEEKQKKLKKKFFGF